MKVVQLIDSLDAGGAERVAVNIANTLVGEIETSYLCTTRKEGDLKQVINEQVKYLFLKKKSKFDLKAILRFKKFLKKEKISIIHAHGSSFFTAVLVRLLYPEVKVIWHDHLGSRNQTKGVYKLILKLSSLFFSQIFCVNSELEKWSKAHLCCKRVDYIPNFPTKTDVTQTTLEGADGKRIICLANLKSPKNHILLLKAFKNVQLKFPDWTLHCIGTKYEDVYQNELVNFIKVNQLEESIFLHGKKNDITHILSQGEIGVLSSSSEGLPMALLEYGLNNLAVITTNVGYCSKLIENDTFSKLVEKDHINEMTNALVELMSDSNYRSKVKERFNSLVLESYSSKNVISDIINIYSLV